MTTFDAVSLGQHAVRLGLVTIDQVQDGFDDLGHKGGDAEPLLRILERKGFLTPWQSQKLLKGDPDGYFLGGYRILYKIASGSFGRVYRADDPRTGTIVAIKVLRTRWTENRKSIDLFEREGKVGMAMKHPNIVEIIAVKCDQKSKQFYIVMEFVEGGNLRDFLKIRKKLEPLETLKILEDVASGLAYSFSHGVSHRDMKLTNILISSTGNAKLVDFGLAGLNQALHKNEQADTDRTVDYAGLEKTTNVLEGDIRSDIYFLGCVAYELLTGRSPLEKSRNPHERMRSTRFLNVKPMRPEELNAPPSVFRLVETMMALNPSQRYQTPSQLLEAVRSVRRELETGQGIQAAEKNKSIFIVESDQRLQDALREGFKEKGFRVLISGDPVRALERFKQQAYDSLVVDVGTVDEDGLYIFERILNDAEKMAQGCVGVLILSENQKYLLNKIKKRTNSKVLIRPVTLKQLRGEVEMLLAHNSGVTA